MSKITYGYLSVIIGLLLTSSIALAVPFEPTFSDYSFPGSQYTVDAAANVYFSANYGITIDNAYLYRDSRDTFDGVGISVGEVSGIGTSQTGRITFLDTTNFVSVDYWGIQPTSYSVFNASNALLGSLSIESNTLGTHLFSPGVIISYLTWSSNGGYGQISGLRYDYDGTTDGRNDDIGGGPPPVPEPSTWMLLATGLAGLAWYGRKRGIS